MNYSYQVTTAPSSEPVTTAEAKYHCHIASSVTADETHLDRSIKAGREACEAFTGRGLFTQTITLKLDRFPTGTTPILLPRAAPLQTMSSVTYTATDGTSTTLTENTHFTKDTSSEPGRIYPIYGTVWPSARVIPNAVTIVYVVGYSTTASIPARIKQGILMCVGDTFLHRESVVVGTITSQIAMKAEQLWMPYVIGDEFTKYGYMERAA